MEQIYKVGDFITDFECIYKITSIESTKNGNLIHYCPIKGTDKVFTDIIPENNLEKSGLRCLLTPKEIKEILKEFKTSQSEQPLDLRQFKENLYVNSPQQLISNLKCFYHQDRPLVRTEEELKEMILNHFCLEISFVTGKKTSDVKKTIESNILGK